MDNQPIAKLQTQYDQFVLKYLPLDMEKSMFFTRRNKFNSWTVRKPVIADAKRWHLRLGHPGPKALEHLVNATIGARIRGPLTVECDSCGTSKMKRQIHRERREIQEGPGLELAVNFYDYEKGYGGYTSSMLVTDRWSGFIWDYYLQNRNSESINQAIRDLLGVLAKLKINPRVIECDNEIYSQKPQVRLMLEKDFQLKVEPSAPYTQLQNGAAERSGGVIKDKERAMRNRARNSTRS
jgi:hypothetical protein